MLSSSCVGPRSLAHIQGSPLYLYFYSVYLSTRTFGPGLQLAGLQRD